MTATAATMTVRRKLALTIFATGLATALLVIASVLVAFERFERETTYQRARGFLERVAMQYDHIVELHERYPDEFDAWLANLVLFEPDSQLYLLDPEGRVLASSARLASDGREQRVAMGPVMQAAGNMPSAYVMGDDPERMDADAIVSARALRRTAIRLDAPIAAYLYLVCHPGGEAAGRWAAVRSSYGMPALALIAAIVALTTLLAAWVTASITRPLARLTGALAAVSREGLEAGAGAADLPPSGPDEFGQLSAMFQRMLATLRAQWAALRRLDSFRREAVSNLSHDLRSPLTATVACLETLDARPDTAPAQRELIEVALRNTRNAARLVQSLGDLAQLDEPAFRLDAVAVDAGELIDDIALRFAERARVAGVDLAAVHAPGVGAWLDIELFERALANLLDNALRFCRAGDRIEIRAGLGAGGGLEVGVADTGAGIAAADLPQLFERFFQGRDAAAATGKGLGLAIVKRIAELHGGDVAVESAPGEGTTVTLRFAPAPVAASGKP